MNKLFPTVFGFIILIIISISWYNSQSKNEVSPKEEALIKSEVDKLIEESKKSYEEKQIQDWSIRYYVDEFGDPATSKYVSAFIQNGSFSNSAVTKRKLYSSIIVDDDDISIQLSEYRIGEYVKGNDEQYIVKIKQNDDVIEAVPFISFQALATYQTASKGISINGIDVEAEKRVSILPDYMIYGSLDNLNKDNSIIIGSWLASYLGIFVGDKINITTSDIKSSINVDSNPLQSIKLANVLIDFTTPQSTLENVKIASLNKTAVVIGTTGLTESQKGKIKSYSKKILKTFDKNSLFKKYVTKFANSGFNIY